MEYPETHLLAGLEDWFRAIPASCTAFSGGVDSALVLFLSHRFLGSQASAAIADSPSLKRKDLNLARSFCERHGIRLYELKPGEVDDPRYASNPPNRCFYCKDHLYHGLREIVDGMPGCVLLNGTNRDDLADYRPGLKAASTHGIRSPLAECGIGKAAVRALAKQFELPEWEKPASPCLSSRIPYGEAVTPEKLARIEAAEGIMEKHGFEECRVRHMGRMARLEVPVADLDRLRDDEGVEAELLALGFERVLVDDEGLVSGKLNRKLEE